MKRVRVFALSAALLFCVAPGFAGVIGTGDGAVPTPTPTPVEEPMYGTSQTAGTTTDGGESSTTAAIVSIAINTVQTVLGLF